MQHPDEGTIHAWIDGQLSADEGAALEAHAGECAECRAAIADARGIIAASSRIVSALDIVPGGVIPEVYNEAQSGTEAQSLEARRARARRPWYASTQLRAAAAVLFVAAASLMVVRQRGAENLPQAASELRAVPGAGIAEATAPEAAQSIADGAGASGARDAAKSATVARREPPPAAKAAAPREADMEQSVRRAVADAATGTAKVVDAPATLAPPVPAPAPAPAQAQAQANRVGFTAPPRLEGVVVTGVAVATAGEREAAKVPGILLLRTDTAGSVITKVYRAPEGVEITLTETAARLVGEVSGVQRERRLQSQGAARPMDAAIPAPPPPAQASGKDSAGQTPVISIRWTDSAAKRLYILSGAVSRERLEAIRKEIERR